MKSLSDLGGLVYSTESGRMCPDCRQPVAQCTCGQNKPLPTGDGIVRVSRETKGRGGKAVTVVSPASRRNWNTLNISSASVSPAS